MANNEYPRLCGATVFSLILHAREEAMKQREHLKGHADARVIPNTMLELLWVMTGDRLNLDGRATETFGTNVNRYRFGKIAGGAHVHLEKNSDTVKAFDREVKENYAELLHRMDEMIDKFLEVGTGKEKDKNLVKAFLDLIDQDRQIKSDDLFYVMPDGSSLIKTEVLQLRHICFPSFVLGVWHYALAYPENNREAEATMEILCPKGKRNQRLYRGSLGCQWTNEIHLHGLEETSQMPDGEELMPEEGAKVTDDEDMRTFGQEECVIPHINPGMNQFIAHPKTNVHYGSGDIFSDIDTLTITKNYYGGKGE